MTVTFRNLSGARENLDKTIRKLLSDNWNSVNTNSLTPDFESDTEEPDFLARVDETGPNKCYISWILRQRTDDVEEVEALGDSIHLWEELIVVELNAESLSNLTLFEDEVNRIIWENRPNGATRLAKSDAADSHIEYFDKSELSFERIEPEDENDVVPKSNAELTGFYYKNKT